MADPLKPNTFIIGAPKCATTALAFYLSQHPQGFLGYPKEPSFWSMDFKRGKDIINIDTIDDYLRIYTKAGGKAAIIDASTRYLQSMVAVPNILDFNPDAKFVVLLRNPIGLAHAYHMEQVFNLNETEIDFSRAWELSDRRAGGHDVPHRCIEPKTLDYKSVAAIGRQLERAVAIIPKRQLLTLFYDDFCANPRALYLYVLSFLRLADDKRTTFPVIGRAHFNRSHLIAGLYFRPPLWLRPMVRMGKQFFRQHLPRTYLEQIKSLLIRRGDRAAIETEFRRELTRYFETDIRIIESLTKRNLSHWRDKT